MAAVYCIAGNSGGVEFLDNNHCELSRNKFSERHLIISELAVLQVRVHHGFSKWNPL